MTEPISIADLEKYLWDAAVLLRGQIDASGYKEFIFPLLFFKRICDVYDEEFQRNLEEAGGDAALPYMPSLPGDMSFFVTLLRSPEDEAEYRDLCASFRIPWGGRRQILHVGLRFEIREHRPELARQRRGLRAGTRRRSRAGACGPRPSPSRNGRRRAARATSPPARAPGGGGSR